MEMVEVAVGPNGSPLAAVGRQSPPRGWTSGRETSWTCHPQKSLNAGLSAERKKENSLAKVFGMNGPARRDFEPVPPES
jgi:hypothetical protein